MEVVKMGATGLEPVTPKSKRKSGKSVTETPEIPLAHSLAHDSQKCPPIDADLARLIAGWPGLSATVKRMILAALDVRREGGPGASE
jgi:hypothetical protein